MKSMRLKNWLLMSFIALGMTAFAQTAEEISNLIKKEDYAAAKKACNDWKAKDPKSGDPYFFLGEIAYETEKIEEARAAYAQGLVVNEDGWLCLAGQAKQLLDDKKTAEAQKVFDKIVKKTRNKNPDAFYYIAKAYLNGANVNADKAIEASKRAVELNSKQSTYYTVLGDSYLAKKDNGNAVTNFEFANEKNKKDPENYLKRARIWKNAKVWPEAEKVLNECLAIDQNYAPAIKELTEVYVGARQFSKITPLLKRYNELVGNDPDSRLRYVKYLCYYAEDFETAIAESNKVLASNPKMTEVYRWLAWANTRLGSKAKEEKADAAKITEYYKNGIDFSKKFLAEKGDLKVYASDYENLMLASVENKDMESAEKYYTDLLTFDSTNTRYYEKIARGYYDAKNYEKAIAAYGKKIEKTKPSVTDHSFVGLSYMALKNYKDADAAFAKATTLNDTYLYAHRQRAKCNEFLDPDLVSGLAKPHYEKVILIGEADAVKNKKDLIAAYNYLGYFYVQKNTPDENRIALDNFRKSVALEPNADLSNNIATLEASLGTAVPIGNK